MSFKIGSLAVVAGAVLAVAGTGLAFQAAHQGHMGHGGASFFSQAHVQMMADHCLAEVEATPDQREKVQAIVAKAFDGSHKEDFHAVHAELAGILLAPTVDRDRLEALRAKHVEEIDQQSKRIASALADIAEVLTPDQRAKLAAHAHAMVE
jgi:Spy/CpxP family protein refolding chaperone